MEGSACGYCHMLEHPKAIALDKRQRVLMTSLRDAEKVRLLLPPLQEKARGFFGQRGGLDIVQRPGINYESLLQSTTEICLDD